MTSLKLDKESDFFLENCPNRIPPRQLGNPVILDPGQDRHRPGCVFAGLYELMVAAIRSPSRVR